MDSRTERYFVRAEPDPYAYVEKETRLRILRNAPLRFRIVAWFISAIVKKVCSSPDARTPDDVFIALSYGVVPRHPEQN